MYSYETSHFVPPPAPAKESECFAGGLWGPHVCRACLELRNQSVRSPSFPLLDLPQLHLCRKESGTPQAHFAEPLRHPSVNRRPPASCRAPHAEPAPVARRTWRREARAHAVTSPHLAPAAGAGVARGGPRGRGRKKNPRPFSRDFAPAGSQRSAHRLVHSTRVSSGGRTASEGVGAGRASRCRRGERKRPGTAAEGAACARADAARSRLPGPRQRPGVRSGGARSRADGGASPPRLSRCTGEAARGAALSPPESQHG